MSEYQPISQQRAIALTPEATRRLRDFRQTWKMRLYFWKKLPTLLFWGVKVQSVEAHRCEVRIPYGWRTQNPFRSMYFAAQCGAAELATGLLATLAVAGQGRISMLITGVEAEFVKKAVSTTIFTCDEGERIFAAVREAIATREGQEITVNVSGRQDDGELVSRLRFRWSFKVKAERG